MIRGSHLHGPADSADDASRRRSRLGRSRPELQDEEERPADSGLVEFLLGYGAEAGESTPPLEESTPARRPPPPLLDQPAPEARRGRYRTRRFRQAVLLGLVAAAALVAVGFLRWASGSDGPFTPKGPPKQAQKQTQKQVFRPPAARVVAAAAPERSPDAEPGAPVPVRAVAARPAVTRVAVTARARAWVVARDGSATARVLYVGNLPAGKTMTVSARRIWLRLGSASSVHVTVNGRPVGRGLAGVVDLVLTPHGVAGGL